MSHLLEPLSTGHTSSNQHRSYINHRISPRDHSIHRPSAKSGKIRAKDMKMPWIRKLQTRFNDHKRKQDSDGDEYNDDDEASSAGFKTRVSHKKEKTTISASGSAQLPRKDDEQSSKKPQESDASASKQHPALTLTGWQITDTRDAGAYSSMHRSDPESDHSEQSSDDFLLQDEGNDSR
ncbi:hypothetical protein Tco_0848689 [Tanacetum coccineum]